MQACTSAWVAYLHGCTLILNYSDTFWAYILRCTFPETLFLDCTFDPYWLISNCRPVSLFLFIYYYFLMVRAGFYFWDRVFIMLLLCSSINHVKRSQLKSLIYKEEHLVVQIIGNCWKSRHRNKALEPFSDWVPIIGYIKVPFKVHVQSLEHL